MKMGIFIVIMAVLYWGIASFAQSMLAASEPCDASQPMWAEAGPQSELYLAQAGVVTANGQGCAE
ncbi:hypothetical protein ABFZ85_02565 [Hyphococcus formosus]|uniref:hypothetical protein n=1 Tax=Hyphococcus formosus TaxID=3143534 RepID=UPI00398B4757